MRVTAGSYKPNTTSFFIVGHQNNDHQDFFSYHLLSDGVKTAIYLCDMEKKVLLTGISGFLGSHTAIQLLKKGYHVIGTLRDLKRADEIKQVIARHAAIEKLSFEQAELSDETIWTRLTKGVDYVQHIASPFPRTLPKHEDELILPAKNGVLSRLSIRRLSIFRW